MRRGGRIGAEAECLGARSARKAGDDHSEPFALPGELPFGGGEPKVAGCLRDDADPSTCGPETLVAAEAVPAAESGTAISSELKAAGCSLYPRQTRPAAKTLFHEPDPGRRPDEAGRSPDIFLAGGRSRCYYSENRFIVAGGELLAERNAASGAQGQRKWTASY